MAAVTPARPYWRYPGTVAKRYEPEFLMKLGNLTRDDALRLIVEHHGDRDRINAELISRRYRTTDIIEIDTCLR